MWHSGPVCADKAVPIGPVLLQRPCGRPNATFTYFYHPHQQLKCQENIGGYTSRLCLMKHLFWGSKQVGNFQETPTGKRRLCSYKVWKHEEVSCEMRGLTLLCLASILCCPCCCCEPPCLWGKLQALSLLKVLKRWYIFFEWQGCHFVTFQHVS